MAILGALLLPDCQCMRAALLASSMLHIEPAQIALVRMSKT